MLRHSVVSSPVFTAVAACAALFGLLWFLAVPVVISQRSFITIALLVSATVFITLMSWRSGQATGSIGQVIHEADLRETEVSQDARPGRAV